MIPLLILLQTALHAYTILDSKLQTQDILSIWDNDHTDQANMQSSGCYKSSSFIYRFREPYSSHQYLQQSNGSHLKNSDISGTIFTLSVSILILNSECIEGARDVRVL